MTDLIPPSDVALLRTVLSRELETINEYEQFAEMAQEEDLRAFFKHLADEEKEHVAEAMALINARDAVQRKHWDDADIRPEHFIHGKAYPAPEASPPSGADASGAPVPEPLPIDIGIGGQLRPGRKFTVGSLKRKR